MLIAIVLAFLACAALTLSQFRAKGAMMGVVMMLQMIPGIAILIPQFIVFNRFGLLDTYTGLILAYVASVLPVAIWNMHGFFLAMPPALFESARVDGANEWQILMHITFPIALPGVISTSVLAFIHSWNDYLIAYTFMKDPGKYTLPVWLVRHPHRHRRGCTDGGLAAVLAAGHRLLHAGAAGTDEGIGRRIGEIGMQYTQPTSPTGQKGNPS